MYIKVFSFFQTSTTRPLLVQSRVKKNLFRSPSLDYLAYPSFFVIVGGEKNEGKKKRFFGFFFKKKRLVSKPRTRVRPLQLAVGV